MIHTYGELADAGQLPVRLWVMAGDEDSELKAGLPRYRTIGRGGISSRYAPSSDWWTGRWIARCLALAAL